MSGALGLLVPVHRCARSVPCVACAVSWAIWLLLNGVLAGCVALRVRCLGLLRSCSPVCKAGVLCCVCGVLTHLTPVHRCACLACCFACAVSWASRLPFTGVFTPRVALHVRCPGPLGSCSPVCTLGTLCRVCGVLGYMPPVARCVRPVCFVARAVSWATWLLFSGVLARRVVLHARCPGPLGSCLRVLLARCIALCVACVLSRATWLLFTCVRAGCAVLHVRGVARGHALVNRDGGFS